MTNNSAPSYIKASCKKQLATLTGLTAAMGEGTLSPEEEAKIAKIDQLHAAEAEKWDKLRAAVAAKVPPLTSDVTDCPPLVH